MAEYSEMQLDYSLAANWVRMLVSRKVAMLAELMEIQSADY